MKKYIVGISIIAAALGVWYFAPEFKADTGSEIAPGGEFMILKKDASWGPCPSRDPNACKEHVELWSSGRFVYNETVKMLPSQEVSKMIEVIRATGIMKKNCATDGVLDYSATYDLNDGPDKKTVVFPGCESELRSIDEVLAGLLKYK